VICVKTLPVNNAGQQWKHALICFPCNVLSEKNICWICYELWANTRA